MNTFKTGFICATILFLLISVYYFTQKSDPAVQPVKLKTKQTIRLLVQEEDEYVKKTLRDLNIDRVDSARLQVIYDSCATEYEKRFLSR